MADVDLLFNLNSTRWKIKYELNRNVFDGRRFVY